MHGISYRHKLQPGPSMTSLVCSDPPKMVCSDPPNMVCSDPFYILEGSLQTKDVIDGPRCICTICKFNKLNTSKIV